jgi:hypothetical protein
MKTKLTFITILTVLSLQITAQESQHKFDIRTGAGLTFYNITDAMLSTEMNFGGVIFKDYNIDTRNEFGINPKNSGLNYKKSYSLYLSAYWLPFIKNLCTQN